jgi:hypothetical protein
MMKKRILAGMAAMVALTAFAPAAFADPPKKEQNVEYQFTDDKLLGDTIGTNTAQIRVVNFIRRERLHKPRTQFVQEMLKSVENM